MKKLLLVVLVISLAVSPLIGCNPGNQDEGEGESGGKIAFTSKRDGNQEIYVMNADGSDQTRLTNNPAQDREPCFSPDGIKITFGSERDGNRNQEIYIMNVDGSNPTNLTNHPAQDWAPCFSPDGTKIVFQSLGGFEPDIYVMNADGSNRTRLTKNPSIDRSPSWSP